MDVKECCGDGGECRNVDLIAELQSKLDALEKECDQEHCHVRMLDDEKQRVADLQSRLDSAIEIRFHPSEKFRYSLSWRKGACVGETLSKALETMSRLIEGHEPKGILEAAEFQRMGLTEAERAVAGEAASAVKDAMQRFQSAGVERRVPETFEAPQSECQATLPGECPKCGRVVAREPIHGYDANGSPVTE